MKFLGTIKDEKFFSEEETVKDKEIKERKSVRIILFDNDKNVALYQYLPKPSHPEGEAGLPGGGVEKDESILDAVKRETFEETGCEIQDLKELGYIIEHIKKDESTTLIQEVHCFTGNVLGDKKEPQFTDKEKEDLMTIIWKGVEESIDIISKQEPTFTRTRCLIFLNELKNSISRL